MVFYLKLNRLVDYSIRNMQSWINAILYTDNPMIYVLCDNDVLNSRMKNEIDFKGINYTFLKSIKRPSDKELVEAISVPRWRNAAYAHLTPFIHAKESGYDSFWNIDADDTLFGIEAEKLANSLMQIRKYAEYNEIDLFSLDMWRSRSNGIHWSFGITYTNGKKNWLDIMNSHKDCANGSQYFMNGNKPKNIDEYFTYIKGCEKNVRIETFYIENLMFLHYSEDFVMNPITSGIYMWRNKKVIFPIIKYVYGVDSLGEIDIAEDVIKFDFGISENEGGWSFAKLAPFSIEATNIMEATEYKIMRDESMKKQISRNVDAISATLKKKGSVFIFGFGNYTEHLIDVLNDYKIEMNSILDNAEFKWGGPIKGLIVESPEKLKETDRNDFSVLIDVRHYEAIQYQLLEMGIKEDQIFIVANYSEV